MTTRDLRRSCEAAEKQARWKHHVGEVGFVMRLHRAARGASVAFTPQVADRGLDVPVVRAEIEAAGDGEQHETLVRFVCRDVHLFLQQLAECVAGDVELRVA